MSSEDVAWQNDTNGQRQSGVGRAAPVHSKVASSRQSKLTTRVWEDAKSAADRDVQLATVASGVKLPLGNVSLTTGEFGGVPALGHPLLTLDQLLPKFGGH